jgi:hypothetical protein
MEGKMAKYKVKLVFKYSDIVHVEARNKEEAETKALAECQEEYESFYDSEIEEEV